MQDCFLLHSVQGAIGAAGGGKGRGGEGERTRESSACKCAGQGVESFSGQIIPFFIMCDS